MKPNFLRTYILALSIVPISALPALSQSVDGTPSGAAAWNSCWILKNKGYHWGTAIQIGINPAAVLADSMRPMPAQMNRNYQLIMKYVDTLKGLPDSEFKAKSNALTMGTVKKSFAMCPSLFPAKDRAELQKLR
jgi:hypothetical protein